MAEGGVELERETAGFALAVDSAESTGDAITNADDGAAGESRAGRGICGTGPSAANARASDAGDAGDTGDAGLSERAFPVPERRNVDESGVSTDETASSLADAERSEDSKDPALGSDHSIAAFSSGCEKVHGDGELGKEDGGGELADGEYGDGVSGTRLAGAAGGVEGRRDAALSARVGCTAEPEGWNLRVSFECDASTI